MQLRDIAAARPHPREASSPATFRPRRLWRCTLSRTPSTPSTACSPPRLPSRLAATRNAPEVPPSGPCSSPGIGASLEARALLRVSPAGVAAKRHPRSPASEPCSPQGIRTAWDRTPVAAVALLTFNPSRLSTPAGCARLPGHDSRALFHPALASEASAPRSISPAGTGISSLPRRRPSWAFSPPRETSLQNSLVSVTGSAYRLNPTSGILKGVPPGFVHRRCG